MALAEDHDVLEELAATAADPALRHWILPGTAVRDAPRLGAHRLHESDHFRAKDRVAVEDEMPWCRMICLGAQLQ